MCRYLARHFGARHRVFWGKHVHRVGKSGSCQGGFGGGTSSCRPALLVCSCALDSNGLVVMIVILSPHPDDAVFSAWHVLTSTGEAEIVNVFSGIPEPGFVTALDLAHGAEESAAWMRRRRAEDRVVLDSIGRFVRNLDFLDVAYRAEAMSRTSHCERPPA